MTTQWEAAKTIGWLEAKRTILDIADMAVTELPDITATALIDLMKECMK